MVGARVVFSAIWWCFGQAGTTMSLVAAGSPSGSSSTKNHRRPYTVYGRDWILWEMT